MSASENVTNAGECAPWGGRHCRAAYREQLSAFRGPKPASLFTAP